MLADPGNGVQKADAHEHAAPHDPGSSMQEVNTSKPAGPEAMRNDSEGTEPGEPGASLKNMAEEIASAIDLSQMSGWPGHEGDDDVDDWEKVRDVQLEREVVTAACNKKVSVFPASYYSGAIMPAHDSRHIGVYKDLTCSGGLWRV